MVLSYFILGVEDLRPPAKNGISKSSGLAFQYGDISPTLWGMASQFPMTRWSVVLAAQGGQCSGALAELCEAYWVPLYGFVRRRGYSPEDAEDLTQAFFGRLIEKDVLAKASAERGKLRSFLLGSMKNFLSDEWDKANAQKRGGGKEIISIDAELAEERFASEPPDEESPDRLFERRWALTLLERVMTGLRGQYEKKGQESVFEELHQFLAPGEAGESYRGAAETLGMTENAVRVAVFRMRQRYAEELREQIAATVETEDEIAAEIDFLFQAVR